jgi:uncharacterized membrane protein
MMRTRSDAGGDGQLVPGAVIAILILAAVCGMALSLAVPVLNAADEVFHWQRAVQVSQGQFFADRKHGPNGYGGRIDTAALEFAKWASQRLESSQHFGLSEARQAAAALPRDGGSSAASFPSTASFSPLAYLPQAAGIATARAAGADVFAQLMAGRIANLIAYLSLIGLAVRLAPCGSRLLLALSLTAPALHLAASVSGDPLNFGFPAVLFAWCLRLRFEPAAMLPRAARYGLGLLVIALALLKPLHLLLAAIVLLVPARQFGGRRAMAVFIAWTLGIGLALTLAWNANYPFLPGRYWGTGAEPSRVLLAIAGDPAKAIGFFLHSLEWQMPIMWMDGWGRFGGFPPPFMMNVPKALSWAGLGALLALALAEARRKADWPAAALMAALALLFTCAIFGAFWLAFSPPGSAVIEGVQGRYFQLAFLLAGWAMVCAAPARDRLGWLRTPAFSVALILQAAALAYGLEHFRFYWAN